MRSVPCLRHDFETCANGERQFALPPTAGSEDEQEVGEEEKKEEVATDLRVAVYRYVRNRPQETFDIGEWTWQTRSHFVLYATKPLYIIMYNLLYQQDYLYLGKRQIFESLTRPA